MLYCYIVTLLFQGLPGRPGSDGEEGKPGLPVSSSRNHLLRRSLFYHSRSVIRVAEIYASQIRINWTEHFLTSNYIF